jgi:hypothetical protein
MLFRKSLQSGCILILGMHRSGTSCLAGSLQKRGLFLGEVHVSNPHNRKGNRENQKCVDLNTSILRYNGAEWDRPPLEKLTWNASHARELQAIVAAFDAVNLPNWGFKDPRTLLTLPFWLSGIEKPQFIGTIRHPTLVAESLQRRNGFAITKGFDLWLAYNARLLQMLEHSPFPILSFDADPDKYISRVDAVAKQVGLTGKTGDDDDFYDQGLLVQHEPDDDTLPEPVRIIYEKIMAHVT